MFQWLYEGTIGNLMAPVEETIDEKVQVMSQFGLIMKQNAVSTGDLNSLEECIRNGFDVVNYTEQGNGLIHLASYKGQLRILQRLILQGI